MSEEYEGKADFELEREATRPEALVMLIRALGKDLEARSYSKAHPFSDVPHWADGYVAYAFDNSIAKGVSKTEFGTTSVTDAQYLTFMLRALGYTEEEGDYTWDEPYEFAALKGIQNKPGGVFLRSQMADITYHALYAKLKDTDMPLWKRLENDGVIESGIVPEVKLPTVTYAEAFEAIAHDDNRAILGTIDTDVCSVVQSCIKGTPHGSPYSLHLVYKSGSFLGEGTVIRLPIPPSNGWGLTDSPDEIYLSDDKGTLYYSIYFASDAGAMFNENKLLHERGNYEYTVNLRTGEVSLNLNREYVK